MKKHISFATMTIIMLLALIFGQLMADSQYFYYYDETRQINVDIYDTLVAIRMDTTSMLTAAQIAQMHAPLKNDFDYLPITGKFYVYGIEPGYNIEQVIDELRMDEEIFMVNPVIVMRDTIPIYLDNSLIAMFNEELAIDQIQSLADMFGLTIRGVIDEEDSTFYVMEYRGSTDQNLLEIANAVSEIELCIIAEPNFFYNYNNLLAEPQDPYFAEQWHLHNTGQTGGTEDCDIDFPEAWEYESEGMRKCLAIIDKGFEMDHEDLPAGWCYRPYDVVGYDIHNPNPDTDPYRWCDDIRQDCWHGTMMLGLVTPIVDNSVGLSGITDYNMIKPIKFCDNQGRYRKETILQALYWAAQPGFAAQITCCGWYMPDTSRVVEIQLEDMYDHGTAVFFAAGNSGFVEYPACLPYVCAVGATDHNDDVPQWSGHGLSLDIVAPGKNIWSFDLNGADGLNPALSICNSDPDYYCYFTGTSVSVAVASGIALRILSLRPDLIPKGSNAQPLFDVLKNTAIDLGDPDFDPWYGWGRVNAYEAIVCHGICGNANNDASVNVADAVWIIVYVFGGGDPPKPVKGCGDVNNDGYVNVVDATYIINYVFAGGSPPGNCYLGYWYSHGGDCCPF